MSGNAQGADPADPTFGDRLRREREAHGRSLSDVVRATRIGGDYLEALERNDFEALPGPAFGKLYIRAYAEMLGFDPQPLIAEYDRELMRRMRAERAGKQAAGPAKRSRRIVFKPETTASAEPAEPVAQPDDPPPAIEPVAVAVEPEPEPVEDAPPESADRAEAVEPLTEPRQDPRSDRTRLALAVGLPVVALLIVAAWILGLRQYTEGPPPARTAEPAEPVEVAPPQDLVDPSPATAEPPPPAASDAEPPANLAAVPATAAPPPSRLTVVEHGLGRRVVDRRLREPTDTFAPGGVAWFQTRVTGGRAGERIRHVWIHEGRTVQAIELKLGGSHWRTHSNKTLWKEGQWVVEARDADGHVLARQEFTCARAKSSLASPG